VSISAFSGKAKLVIVPAVAVLAPKGITLKRLREYPLSFCDMNLTFWGINIPSIFFLITYT